jgi:DNA (cytosine-5)-methyltransferase 1
MSDAANSPQNTSPLRVAELFAGVGGFRLGLEGEDEQYSHQFSVTFSNQWEPSTKRQHASEVYVQVFGSTGHNSKDISTVTTESIPKVDVLVGGFPCQDYSVAKTLSSSMGIVGKKGVLWWDIYRILKEKIDIGETIPYVVLENVDRLIKSPSTQRGRDFAIMLWCLNSLNYDVEWRVINAADYGFPQRRRRLFIVAVQRTHTKSNETPMGIGVLERAFPIKPLQLFSTYSVRFSSYSDVNDVSDNFNRETPKRQVFKNSGFTFEGCVYTSDVDCNYNGEKRVLAQVLEDFAPEEYYISDSDIDKWKYLKGAKAEKRISADGFEYNYTEGSMVFPDRWDKPSRTIITGEGGRTPSRFKHVVECKSTGRLRRLTPIELEQLNMFPKDHTSVGAGTKMTDTKRAFFMGNALVVGVVDNIARALWKHHCDMTSTS